MFGDLELTCSAIWRNHVWRFGVNVFGDLEESCSAIWANRVRRFLELTCSVIFGVNMFGNLEESCSSIWVNRVRRFGRTWRAYWRSSRSVV